MNPAARWADAKLTGARFFGHPVETPAALTDHIPNAGQQLIRTLGRYSNKSHGLRTYQERARELMMLTFA